MIRGIVYFFLVLVAVSTSQAQVRSNPLLHSARRLKNESARSAYARYLRRLGGHAFGNENGGLSAVQSAVAVNQADFTRVPRYASVEQALAAFYKIRDSRFLIAPEKPGFPRRSTWLYPDDGCYARAALMEQNLEKLGLVRPAKIFAFGNLRVKTRNSPAGEVSWWYHVVPLVLVNDQPVVFDPAIDPLKPLVLKNWLLAMIGDLGQIKVAVCNGYAYGPSSSCLTSTAAQEGAAVEDQIQFLPVEWDRLVQMHRDPVKELGDSPIWTHAFFGVRR